MNPSMALAVFVAVFQFGDTAAQQPRSPGFVAKAVEAALSSLPLSAATDAEIAMRPRGGSRKKEKAPQFPGVPKSDEPLVEIIFCIAGLVVLFLLWLAYKANGGD